MIEAKDIDLNLLVIFQEVFQERQISSVARKLNLSQPAVSNALARLRKALDDELFVRTSQGMQPTPLAQQLADPVAAALSHITKALNQHASFDAASSQRQFMIAMTDVGEMYFMPILVEQCRRFAPQVQIATVRANNVDLMAEMETGRIDLSLGAFDQVSDALYHRRLFRQDYVCMYRQDHPLMREGTSSKEFLSAEHLIVSTRENPYDKINQSLEKVGITASNSFTVPHFSSVPYIVSSTNLVVIVPQKLAASAAAPFRLSYSKPPIKLPTLQTNIFWHRRFAQDEGNQWLRNLLVECFSDSKR
ncbi:LysR family transcriptional regulator [Undibacterium flavidum]|uniref:LysR family transcriptional regulator n=1 Tax=Undibacterium flavidum TaxID=2762297 RepID=A0ABR6Y8M7_9BURK|nr:LysR family transcriptional regulator [Undibacterium flavidum]MBC3872965.1 LysR family transcriptional regulator [Undibacterium flavidum]